ncbi:MAG: Riboflavin synthase alpha chain [Pseudomonadota bacterium]|jgi:riboflavin synthase
MFTGIVQALAQVVGIQRKADIVALQLKFPANYLEGIAIGASVSVQGCCLTVTAYKEAEAAFDMVPETISRTSFSNLKEGDVVNVERSLKFGDEVGGHILSGHVDVVASIVAIEKFEHSRVVTFQLPDGWIKYVFEKGYIALNGASLTITDVVRDVSQFKVSLIPETLAKTTFGSAKVGDRVNVEIDRNTQAIVDTVERVLAQRGANER